MKIESYSIEKKGVSGLHKTPALYGNGRGCSSPLIYLKKAKWISEESFQEILGGLKLQLPIGFEIKKETEDDLPTQ